MAYFGSRMMKIISLLGHAMGKLFMTIGRLNGHYLEYGLVITHFSLHSLVKYLSTSQKDKEGKLVQLPF